MVKDNKFLLINSSRRLGPYPILFKTVLDCHTLFESKLESDWRIIAQDPDYQDPTPSEITSINPALGVAHNADFSIAQKIDEETGLHLIHSSKKGAHIVPALPDIT